MALKKAASIWVIERRKKGSGEDYQPTMLVEHTQALANQDVAESKNPDFEYRAIEYVRRK